MREQENDKFYRSRIMIWRALPLLPAAVEGVLWVIFKSVSVKLPVSEKTNVTVIYERNPQKLLKPSPNAMATGGSITSVFYRNKMVVKR